MTLINILGMEMTLDEANRLKEWLMADSGRRFWQYIGNSRQTAYEHFIGKAIENPLNEVLETQRQKAQLAVYDELLSIPQDVENEIRAEKKILT
jgi:hypothetical protein